MPVAQFAGNRGWGNDGVLLYATHRAYGTPDRLNALVDAAHARGLMVLLDVAYNQFGRRVTTSTPTRDFFVAERHTPKGPAIAYAREPVRRFVIEKRSTGSRSSASPGPGSTPSTTSRIRPSGTS